MSAFAIINAPINAFQVRNIHDSIVVHVVAKEVAIDAPLDTLIADLPFSG